MANQRYIVGLHEGSILDQHNRGEALMEARAGPYVFTELIGNRTLDYSRYTERGHPVLVRINWSYGTGTLPVPALYDYFAEAVAETARHIVGAITGIVFANEPNHPAESPTAGQAISALQYAAAFRLAYAALEAARPDLDLFVAGIAPYAAVAEPADWVEYLAAVLANCGPYDGVALHTYTHGHDPALVSSERTMDPPFGARRYEFRAYQDFMAVIPAGMPVYITEANPGANPDSPRWEDVNNGWCQAAAGEIDGWNRAHLDHQVRGLAFFRYPEIDSWRMASKPALLADVQAAIERGYEWIEEGPEMTYSIAYQTSFEEGFYDYQGQGEVTCPNGWVPGWKEESASMKRPEWDSKRKADGHPEIRTGSFAANFFSTYSQMKACLYRLFNLTPGARFRASVWCMAKSTGACVRGMQMVADPNGGNDWEKAGLPASEWWSSPDNPSYDGDWHQLTVEGTIGAGGQLIVFLRGNTDDAIAHHGVHWDDFVLEVEAGVTPPEPGPIYEDGEAILAYCNTMETILAGLRDIATRVGSGADPRVGQLIDTAVADLTEARNLV